VRIWPHFPHHSAEVVGPPAIGNAARCLKFETNPMSVDGRFMSSQGAIQIHV